MNAAFRRVLSVTAAGLLLAAVPTVRGEDRPRDPDVLILRFQPGTKDSTLDPHRFQLGPELAIDPADRSLRLARSVLVADEVGATDFRQTETLTDRVRAKKVFHLPRLGAETAELFIFGNAQHIHLNGRPLDRPTRLHSTGWKRVAVPLDALKAGDNEVVFTGPGQLLVEPGRGAGRSFKSTDGGKTWSGDSLGSGGGTSGEYVVRLRLGQYAERGSALSAVVDLWQGAMSDDVAMSGVLERVGVPALIKGKQAPGTELTVALRTGSTPSPQPGSWTDWSRLDGDHQPDERAAGHRWGQLRFDFMSRTPAATPRLRPGFELVIDRRPAPPAGEVRLASAAGDGGMKRPLVSAVPFVYQPPSPRLKLLRDRYRLDEVIAPGKTEMEQLMLLRHWVRNQWHTGWRGGADAWMPPWDALIILESKDQPDCLTMCTHYAAVFTQCCLALGWNARHCILDHHCVSEVWVDQHARWVMMDPGNSQKRADVTLHFERRGIPQSARELHLAVREGKTDELTVHFTPAALRGKIEHLCRPALKGRTPVKADLEDSDSTLAANLKDYPVCQLGNYRRYAFPARNTYLDSLYPGELYQGWSPYFYDGYWWVGDSRDGPRQSPEYTLHLPPEREQDVDWSLNWTRIHLARTAQPGVLQVDLETHTPNLARHERHIGKVRPGEKDRWEPVPVRFVWKLQPGSNVLWARSVNRWDRAGLAVRAEVTYAPPGR